MIVYMHGNVEFDDALWDQWLEALPDVPVSGCLLCASGDIKPSNKQWKRATRAMRSGKVKEYAVVTDSRRTSALAKAASWLGIEMKAFRFDELYDASLYLGQDQQLRMAVRSKVEALQKGDSPASASRPTDVRPSAPTSSYTKSTRPPTPKPKPRASTRSPLSSSKPSSEPSRTPMTDAAASNLEQTRRTSEEIQAKLAQIQARLRASRLKKS